MVGIIRYLFIVINTLYFIFGAILVAYGAWLQFASPIREILVSDSVSVTIINFIIAVGALLAIIGLGGCLGRTYDSKVIMAAYVTISGVLLIIEISTIAFGVTGQETLKTQAATTWTVMSNDLKYLIQDRFNCCGYTDASEWNNIFHTSCIADTSINTTWTTGCYTAVLIWLEQDALLLGGIVGGVLVLTLGQLAISSKLLRDVVVNEKKEHQLEDTGQMNTTNWRKKSEQLINDDESIIDTQSNRQVFGSTEF